MVTPEFGSATALEAEVERRKARGQQIEPIVATPDRAFSAVEKVARVKSCDCGAVFSFECVVIDGREVFTPKLCPSCLESFARQTQNMQDQMDSHEKKTAWEAICPPLYRDTDPARLGISPQIMARLNSWLPGQTSLALTGATGTGKTRAMFQALRRLHFAGYRLQATSAKQFEHWCHRMFEREDSARQNIKAAHPVPILFIDDIGKEKYTERVESEFYELIEYRTSHLLPILWTANATGEQLERMMGEDRGTPVVRRLREFSTILSV